MQVGDKHQLKIARDTLKLSVVGAKVLGGMNHAEAIAVIARLAPRELSRAQQAAEDAAREYAEWKAKG